MSSKNQIKTPINNFSDWSKEERLIGAGIDLTRRDSRPLAMLDRLFKVKLSNLSPNKLLYEEAVKRCEAQFKRIKISHDGVEEAFKVLAASGFKKQAEILASGYKTPNEVVNAWLNSRNHRRIILKGSHKYFGVAMRENNGKKYYCILFAK